MGYFDKLAALGFNTVCRRNRLGTTTMFAVHMTEDVGESLDDFLAALPEWRLVDFTGDDAAYGAKMLYEKLTMTGSYVGYDERMARYYSEEAGMPKLGFEHRPENERFQHVED